MPDVIRRVVISGRVQGVGYRAWTASRARMLGLDGWVRNRRDGTVEAVFAGPPDTISQMISDCRRGPVGARVETVRDEPGVPSLLALRPPSGGGFAMIETA